MSPSAAGAIWPAARLAEAILALARKAGLPARDPEPSPGPVGPSSRDAAVHAAAASIGLEAETIDVGYGDVPRFLARAGPAVLATPGSGDGFWILWRVRRGSAVLLDPEWRPVRVPLEEMRAGFCSPLEAQVAPKIEEMLERAKIPERQRRRARLALLRERLSRRTAGSAWLVRAPPSAPMRHLLAEAGVLRQLAKVLVANAALFALSILSWWLIGQGALAGQFEVGWLVAWALLLVTAIPVRVAAVGAAARLAIDAGAVMKRRLLAGALQLKAEAVRGQGAGQILGRVLESEAIESLMLSAGLSSAIAGLQLVLTVPVLLIGAAPGTHLILLGLWTVGAAAIAWREWHWRMRWTRSRLDMTHDLVERMVGHRTRLAQEPLERWHDDEDRLLERYLELSVGCDGASAATSALVHRGWMLLGILALAPAFVRGTPTPGALAVSLGGVVLAAQAWRELAAGVSQLMGVSIAWGSVRPLFEAAEREPRYPPHLPASASECRGTLEISDLSFRYPGRPRQVLSRCDLKIHPGDRLLLEGPSGSGKTALASVLAGLHEPESGLVLLGGVDRASIGDSAWRRRVVCSPQFHENHVVSGTLAFNLLLGRGWPPSGEDLREAEEICRALGLGPLLERMPAGMQQTVGETGWQLSHGEQSRIFVARGLLQRPDVLILDESLAALDPENLEQALNCVLARARTVFLVAHP